MNAYSPLPKIEQTAKIELVKHASNKYVYGVGDSLSPTIKDDQGNTISYVFTVDSLTDDCATLTFTKNKK